MSSHQVENQTSYEMESGTNTVCAFHQRVLGVPSSTRQVRYTTKAQFEQIYDEQLRLLSADITASRSPFLVFTHINPQVFERDFYTDEKSIYDSFEHSLQLLVIKIPLTEHERAVREFSRILIRTLASMNDVDLELDLLGSRDRDKASRMKRPDDQFIPKELPPGYSGNWPTLVVEPGWAESRAKLEKDARWWLNSSEGEVKIALTVSVSRTQREIVMECWELVDRATRLEPDRKAPAVTQRVVLKQTTPNDPLISTNAPLVIDFAKLFLREPNTNKGHGDVVLREGTLEYYALSVWR
ncbi:hypothetical protein PISL3812_08259 [Talaromyces islandicus]|uniref:Uncharacterized protein n=1 Tax=Talaromyces islandicus TaxID=28573 RepID=A0A0U1M823_TALIS|nr:hypothetical protein PISL3812_08259 [Talaromyces islandicus]